MMATPVIRVPTPDEYQAYEGAHTFRLWEATPESWICPGCNRTKFELLMWTTRYRPGVPRAQGRYQGWLAALHEHHDHLGEALWYKTHRHWSPEDLERSRQYGAFGYPAQRFPPTVVCAQCNSTDAAAKRMVNAAEPFSFTPEEISSFVIAMPHGRHRIDRAAAQRAYVLATS